MGGRSENLAPQEAPPPRNLKRLDSGYLFLFGVDGFLLVGFVHMSFDGSTYDAQQDFHRLKGQLDRVKRVLSDGRERTLEQVANEANVPLSTVGSRIRDLRKEFAGALPVQSRRVSKGLWIYWVPQPPKVSYDEHGQGLMGFEGWAA